jgi:hypothetical protein
MQRSLPLSIPDSRVPIRQREIRLLRPCPLRLRGEPYSASSASRQKRTGLGTSTSNCAWCNPPDAGDACECSACEANCGFRYFFLEAILMIEPPKRHSTPLRAAGSYQVRVQITFQVPSQPTQRARSRVSTAITVRTLTGSSPRDGRTQAASPSASLT